ncbi:MAG: malonic semialdehyde reductase [Planktomarina sp.]|nr:malonic semialdehyde reductase [Planktomarina sp.]MDT2033246.1 malonic semialdehyde reductase [Planktomarina sp.]MDT2040116.1 malonic semialdehyde reductase [Planktomarina sp.]MDT2049992.1 malonic semialdehyde reductase [Planktomarina sp.]|tara:strand:+ start:784 stop:1368 length:585 start_codon:yes stop_codon:yes gene_type:complete
MTHPDYLNELFISARTHRFYTDKPVSNDLLHQLYEIVKLGPTESNFCPMRLTFVTSQESRQKVIDAAAEGNRPKIQSAPVVAVVAHDLEFHRHLPNLSPQLDAEAVASQPAEKLANKASLNTWLQVGYLIVAARSLGLDCGPMIGFNAAKIDEAFYANSSWRASMLINIGHGVGGDKIRDRSYRLTFDEACEIV